MKIEEVHANNFRLIQKHGLKVGTELKAKGKDAYCQITHIHKLYGWVQTTNGCYPPLKQDLSNLDEFEIIGGKQDGNTNIRIAENNYHFKIGDNYDEKRICTLQSKEVRFRCKNSNSKNRQSLQVQYQLPHNMDSKIQTESLERQGGRCA